MGTMDGFFKVDLLEVEEKKMWNKFHKLMDEINQENEKEIGKIAKEFGLEERQAADVWYLRTRSRWSEDLEKKLIEELKSGKNINICDWP